MNAIINYYKVCGVKPPEDSPAPITVQMDPKAFSQVFTKKQEELYFKVGREIKENVVGGDEYDYFAESDEEDQKIIIV